MSRPIAWHTPQMFPVFIFGFCPDEETWQANRVKVLRTSAVELRQYPHPGASGMFTCWRDCNDRPHGLVTIHDRYDTDPVGIIGVLAHETVHLVERIFEAASEDEPGEETRAYLTEWCIRTVWLDYVKTRGAPNASPIPNRLGETNERRD